MSQKTISEERKTQPPWEEAVSRYLRDNPNYFLRHPDILSGLTVPHHNAGGAISLLEHQSKILREQNRQYSKRLHELVNIARENNITGERLHKYALAVIDCVSLDDVLHTSREMLRNEFLLKSVVILIQDPSGRVVGEEQSVKVNDHRFEALMKRLKGNSRDEAGASGGDSVTSLRSQLLKPVCGERYDAGLMTYIFGEAASQIKSSAMIPLAIDTLQGVLVLGSDDPHRFRPQMGTEYLEKLGKLLQHGIMRHLR